MRWQLNIGEFGPNIQHIAGVENIVSNILSILPYTSVDKYETSTMKSHCRSNELFTTGRVENSEYFFPIYFLNAKR